MRQKVAIGMFLIFSFAEIKPIFPFLEYFVNFDYISEVLCINKDKPMSTCNGKCYLNQQLEEAQETDEQDKKNPTDEQEIRIPMIVDDYELQKIAIRDITNKKHFDFRQLTIKDLFISPPTPPPKG